MRVEQKLGTGLTCICTSLKHAHLGFGVLGFGFWVLGLGFRVWGLGFRIWGLWGAGVRTRRSQRLGPMTSTRRRSQPVAVQESQITVKIPSIRSMPFSTSNIKRHTSHVTRLSLNYNTPHFAHPSHARITPHLQHRVNHSASSKPVHCNLCRSI